MNRGTAVRWLGTVFLFLLAAVAVAAPYPKWFKCAFFSPFIVQNNHPHNKVVSVALSFRSLFGVVVCVCACVQQKKSNI